MSLRRHLQRTCWSWSKYPLFCSQAFCVSLIVSCLQAQAVQAFRGPFRGQRWLASVALDAEPMQTSLSPYLDSIAHQLESETPSSSFGLQSSEGYSEALQNSFPAVPERMPPSQEALHSPELAPEMSYTEDLQKKLNASSSEESHLEFQSDSRSQSGSVHRGGAIAALHAGRSDLKMIKKGNSRQIFGLRYGVSIRRWIESTQSADAMNHFDAIYAAHYAPDLSLFYEYFLFHHEKIGSLGILGLGGMTYFHGKGRFPFSLSDPNGGAFSDISHTRFQLFAVPLTCALSIRMNVLHWIRPYAFSGPTAIGYMELRSDSQKGNRGGSYSWLSGAGVSILLDAFSPASSWQMYAQNGIRHQYLTFDYARLTHCAGKVHYAFSGWLMGLAFEL